MASDIHQQIIKELKSRAERVKKGGGEPAISKQHAKGKLTARERIQLLIDTDSRFLEVGLFAGEGLYDDHGGCPAGGVIVGIGTVEGRLTVIVANDATVKAGAWFPITAKKNLRAQEIAMENRLPIIYLVDSAGIYLPLQSEVFADKEHFGRVFRNNAQISAMGIVQIAAIMGSCVAGGAYLPVMSDEALIVEHTGSLYLAGPYLVKSAIGEEVDTETLGGAEMHCQISGVTDQKFPDDASCILAIRQRIGQISDPMLAGFNRKPSVAPAEVNIWDILPENTQKPYEVREVLECIVDMDSMQEYKPEYGKTLVCTYARVDGWAVGIVANQRKNVKSGKGEMQMGGVIYGDAADKAARFIMNCNQKKIPLVFFQDVTGFMVGSRAEQGGIIKDGAKMVNVVANSVVPKFTFIVGNSYGAGNYAMCGKSYDPRLIYSWPTAQMAVMSGSTAAKTLLQIQKSAINACGEEIESVEEKALLDKISARYAEELSPYYAAARLWVDGVIDPNETREIISTGISMANNAPIQNSFNVGVFQV